MRIVERGFLRRMRGDVGVEFRARHVLGKKSAARRHGLRADEWLFIVDQVEAAAVDFQIAAQQLVLRVRAVLQRKIELQAFGIALPPVDAVEQARGVDQFGDHLLFSVAQPRGIEGHVNPAEFGDALGQVGCDVQVGGSSLRGAVRG